MFNVKTLKEIKLLIMDVDGVLTDTRIFLDNSGEWKRFFSIRDGVGIKEIQEHGYKTAIITGSKALDIRERAKMLGITYFYEGFLEKQPALEKLVEESGVSPQQMIYIGDDIYDIPLLKTVACAVTVPEAVDAVKEVAHYITNRSGGLGAVREICDLLLKHGYFSGV
jgi:3-deoxy-D-manno-octulosonate 8-phosphate phosphatase (KDO 8-P phosphatase)